MRIALALLCVLTFSCASATLGAQSSWKNLNGVKVGQKIQVIEMDSTKHSGTFLSFSDSAITFREGTGERSVQMRDVRTVKLQNQRRLRNTLIGTGVGAGSGAILGAATTPSEGFSIGKGYAAAFVGTAGAAVGAAIGVLLPTRKTVYKAESH
jgi:hypothetical protein